DLLAGEEAAQFADAFAVLVGHLAKLGQRVAVLGAGPRERLADVLQQRQGLAAQHSLQHGLSPAFHHRCASAALTSAPPFAVVTSWKWSTPLRPARASGSQKTPTTRSSTMISPR